MVKTIFRTGAKRASWGRKTAAVAAAVAMMACGVTASVAEAPAKKTWEQVLEQDRDAIVATDLLELQTPQQATILTPEEFEKTDTNAAIVRLDNRKITFMTKDGQGEPQEFLSMATETGFWDTLSCGGPYENRSDKLFSCVTAEQSPFYVEGDDGLGDYEQGMRNAFKRMKNEYGFNTVQLTMSWAEWDKTSDPNNPRFDYTKMDQLAKWAEEAGLKVFWVLFFHVQTNMPDYHGERSVYNIADDDGYSYGIQWGNEELERPSDYPRNGWNAVPELYPEYSHPVVNKQLHAGLTNLAEHYKDSPNVLGYQIGNEEGLTGPYNNQGDKNPYFEATFQLWSEKRNSIDRKAFTKELGLSIWQQMVSSIRAIDPYKVITTNFQSSDVDKYPTGNTAGGQDLDFYRDAGLDLVAPMYYGDTNMIRGNVDRWYGSSDAELSTVGQELPGLFPSEIGVGYERGPVTQSDILDTLARGGMGYGLYAFGEMEALAPNMQALIKNVQAMATKYEHELWSGLPVSAKTTKNIHLTTADPNMTLSTLETVDRNVAVGILWRDYHNTAGNTGNRPVTVSVKDAGTYTIDAMVNGVPVVSHTATVEAGGSIPFGNITMNEIGAAFIRVMKTD